MTSKPLAVNFTDERRRVLLLDDHPMTRYGMARLIEQEPDLVVCGEAENAQTALTAIKAQRPEVVLVDLTMPGGEGIEFIKDMRALHPEVAILVVSMHDEEVYAQRALRAGSRGYIMKSEGGEQLVKAIRQVLEGKIYLSEKMAGKVLEVFSGQRERGETTTLDKLSDREFEVFRLLGQGLTTREIGQRLRLGTKTVDTHRLHLRQKLGFKTSAALIKHAIQWAGTQQMI
jgi:DNA-binding NarL/FixJ family response regulator